MFIVKPLPFVTTFIDALDKAIEESKPGWGLSGIQKAWLSFCILAILVTDSVCWAKFERASLGRYSLAALSWMFCHSKIPWDLVLQMSVRVILHRYGITQGCLAVDDTDKNYDLFLDRLQQCEAHINDGYDVSGLCCDAVKRLQELCAKKGGRMKM